MSNLYKNSGDVPLDTIADRLRELSDAILLGRAAQASEFTMRIPAECDRDADIVMSEAAKRLGDLRDYNAQLQDELAAAKVEIEKLGKQSMEPVASDQEMTEDFKAAWKNGLPLDSPEAKWAFCGWQETRESEGGEAVATVCMDNSIAILDAPFNIEPGTRLYTNATAPQPDKWIPCSERLPTEADEDPFGFVVMLWMGGVVLMATSEHVRSVFSQLDSEYASDLKWTPTGLTRPAPPEQESE